MAIVSCYPVVVSFDQMLLGACKNQNCQCLLLVSFQLETLRAGVTSNQQLPYRTYMSES